MIRSCRRTLEYSRTFGRNVSATGHRYTAGHYGATDISRLRLNPAFVAPVLCSSRHTCRSAARPPLPLRRHLATWSDKPKSELEKRKSTVPAVQRVVQRGVDELQVALRHKEGRFKLAWAAFGLIMAILFVKFLYKKVFAVDVDEVKVLEMVQQLIDTHTVSKVNKQYGYPLRLQTKRRGRTSDIEVKSKGAYEFVSLSFPFQGSKGRGVADVIVKRKKGHPGMVVTYLALHARKPRKGQASQIVLVDYRLRNE